MVSSHTQIAERAPHGEFPLNGLAMHMDANGVCRKRPSKARGATLRDGADHVTISQKMIMLPAHDTAKAIVRTHGMPAM